MEMRSPDEDLQHEAFTQIHITTSKQTNKHTHKPNEHMYKLNDKYKQEVMEMRSANDDLQHEARQQHDRGEILHTYTHTHTYIHTYATGSDGNAKRQ